VVILFFTVKEKKLAAAMRAYEEKVGEQGASRAAEMDPAVKRSFYFILASIFLWFFAYNAVTTAFSKYAQDYLGIAGGGFANSLMLATGAAVVAFIPAGLIAAKIGRKRTIMAGITILGLCFFIAAFFKSFNPLLNILLVLIGFGWAAINVNSYPMVVEMAKGADIGKYTGYYYTASMSAQILTPILSGVFLDELGYWTLFPYATLFSILAFITMSQVRHGDSKAVATGSKLEMLDVD
jgi:MFS family permease